ncbi:hypothetical protein [Streptomyces sp. NPDC051576]|uniref:hypothetical protein n=1 Tax=Streptomyces sp. NPDC051576 TaxID=3155803 RepID=UPI003432694F
MRLRAAAAVIALLAASAVGCAGHGGAADGSPSASPSGYPGMQQKVAAAESALAQADEDAAQDTSH